MVRFGPASIPDTTRGVVIGNDGVAIVHDFRTGKDLVRLNIDANVWLKVTEQQVDQEKFDWTRIIYEQAVQVASDIAKERGYFEQLGLTIEYDAFPDGAMVVAPLTAGELDVGGFTASAGTFNARFQGAAFRVFMDRGQECPEQAYIGMNVSQELYDAGLTSLEDLHMLRGHRVGVGAPGSINQFTFARALEAAGLDPVNDVEWVEGVPQPDLVGMLGEGRVDATNLAWQLALAAENQGFGPNIITGPSDVPVEAAYSSACLRAASMISSTSGV